FKDLSEAELRHVEKAAVDKTYATGDDIFSQKDRAKAMYLIQFGGVRIHQKVENDDSVEVARLGVGAHFGEMPFIDGEPRSATATAIEKTEIIEIPYDKLTDLFIAHPSIATHFYRQMSHFLCGRLRMTTTDLAFARSHMSHF
ncbi:MAG: cyclic nucleotide-binding domain-containing protein, partial [Bdellovibrionota bacterium]